MTPEGGPILPKLVGILELEASRVGLKVRDCGNGHMRIEGGLFEANWYPFSKKKTLDLLAKQFTRYFSNTSWRRRLVIIN